MTPEEADRLVDRLVVGWHGYQWRDATIAVYADALTGLEYADGDEAVTRALHTLAKPPAIADLLTIAGVESRARQTRERRSGLTADERLSEEYLEAGRAGLAQARAILRKGRSA